MVVVLLSRLEKSKLLPASLFPDRLVVVRFGVFTEDDDEGNNDPDPVIISLLVDWMETAIRSPVHTPTLSNVCCTWEVVDADKA